MEIGTYNEKIGGIIKVRGIKNLEKIGELSDGITVRTTITESEKKIAEVLLFGTIYCNEEEFERDLVRIFGKGNLEDIDLSIFSKNNIRFLVDDNGPKIDLGVRGYMHSVNIDGVGFFDAQGIANLINERHHPENLIVRESSCIRNGDKIGLAKINMILPQKYDT